MKKLVEEARLVTNEGRTTDLRGNSASSEEHAMAWIERSA